MVWCAHRYLQGQSLDELIKLESDGFLHLSWSVKRDMIKQLAEVRSKKNFVLLFAWICWHDSVAVCCCSLPCRAVVYLYSPEFGVGSGPCPYHAAGLLKSHRGMHRRLLLVTRRVCSTVTSNLTTSWLGGGSMTAQTKWQSLCWTLELDVW